MGSRILAGRYELMEKIGEGGMAVVFRAKDRVLSRFVAVKILRPEYTKDDAFIESFRRESQLAASIVDPNIVNVYDVGKEGNIYYIVMELVEGSPLSETIRREAPLNPRRAVAITRQIAMALSTAHKHNLIHRDVKPHNVLLGPNDVAKIADFGIAKVVSNDTLVGEQREAVMGSIHYFSPEQARGWHVDERSDIYSLGIVFYEMVTGKVPFDGNTAVEVAVKHMNEQMVPPSRLNPEIPQDIEDIILKATAKNPEDRYNNADEMITDLSFVKYSKPSDYSKELEEKRAAGEFDFDFLDEPVEEETPKQKKERIKREKEEKKIKKKEKRKKNHHGQRVFAVILAIVLAIPASGVIYNLLFAEKEKASQDVSVPYLVGMEVDEASEFLVEYNLTVEVDMELNSSDYEIGQIISQTPSEGATVKRGSTVKVNISLGANETSVPSVVGKTQENAEKIISQWNCVVGKITNQYSTSIPKGYVISQSPEYKEGVTVAKGTSVNLVISLGEEGVIESAAGGTIKDNKDGTLTITIKNGTSAKSIGTILVDAGFCETPEEFTSSASAMGMDTKLKSGTYTISQDATLEEAIKIIAHQN